MTIDEAIKHCLEVAEEQSRLYSLCPCPCDGTDNCMSLKNGEDMGCTKCAANHRQLANWLRELQELKLQIAEYKRLLKAAVDDMRDVANNGTCNHCMLDGMYAQGGCCTDGCFKWRYADEALKLIES